MPFLLTTLPSPTQYLPDPSQQSSLSAQDLDDLDDEAINSWDDYQQLPQIVQEITTGLYEASDRNLTFRSAASSHRQMEHEAGLLTVSARLLLMQSSCLSPGATRYRLLLSASETILTHLLSKMASVLLQHHLQHLSASLLRSAACCHSLQ
jgi:hypothetical protein